MHIPRIDFNLIFKYFVELGTLTLDACMLELTDTS